LSKSPEIESTNQNLVYDTNPLAMIVHPLYQTETTNLTDQSSLREPSPVAPPKPKPKPQQVSKSDPPKSKSKPKPQQRKTQSSQTIGVRRSQRLVSGFGTKKPPIIDTNVYEIVDSDEEEVIRDESEMTPEIVSQSTPQKAPEKSPPNKDISKTTSPINPPNIAPSKHDR
jgi:hypothetical protein